jgi:hypothetical protein
VAFLADIISAVEFDQTGDYLATGDKGGRVVLFERNESVGFIYIINKNCPHSCLKLLSTEKEL